MTSALIGSGGHASVVYEIAQQNNQAFDFFVDPVIQEFKGLAKLEEYGLFKQYFLGVGGVTPDQLVRRHQIYQNYKQKGYDSFKIISPESYVSACANIGNGVLIAHRVVVQPDVDIGENSIINTGVIIEHGVVIGAGCHIAPGAIILGGVTLGSYSLIGAGAVILPGSSIPANTLIPSLTRYKNDC